MSALRGTLAECWRFASENCVYLDCAHLQWRENGSGTVPSAQPRAAALIASAGDAGSWQDCVFLLRPIQPQTKGPPTRLCGREKREPAPMAASEGLASTPCSAKYRGCGRPSTHPLYVRAPELAPCTCSPPSFGKVHNASGHAVGSASSPPSLSSPSPSPSPAAPPPHAAEREGWGTRTNELAHQWHERAQLRRVGELGPQARNTTN